MVLLDTTGESTLEWTRFPYGPQANTPGVSGFIYLFFFSKIYSSFYVRSRVYCKNFYFVPIWNLRLPDPGGFLKIETHRPILCPPRSTRNWLFMQIHFLKLLTFNSRASMFSKVCGNFTDSFRKVFFLLYFYFDIFEKFIIYYNCDAV